MKNIIRFFQKYSAFFMFITLQIVSLLLVFSEKNPYHHSKFINSSNILIGGIYSTSDNIRKYFYLNEEIEQLRKQNEKLQEKIKGKEDALKTHFRLKKDTSLLQKYYFQNAKVINYNNNKNLNYLTINKGKLNGINKNMGVIGTKGVLGYTIACSNNYSTILPIIHPKFEMAVRHKKSNSFGLLTWNNKNGIIYAEINDIPDFVNVKKGDTIITTGGDGFFPKEELIGFVYNAEEIQGKGTQIVTIKLAEEFNSLHSVFVIKDINSIELRELIDSTQIDA